MTHHPTHLEQVVEQKLKELLVWIRIGVMCLMFIAVSVFLAGCSRADQAKADKAAQEYMRNVPGATGFSCVASDSDNDGYCSCTIFRGSADPLPVQCGCERHCGFDCASGCKYVPFAGAR